MLLWTLLVLYVIVAYIVGFFGVRQLARDGTANDVCDYAMFGLLFLIFPMILPCFILTPIGMLINIRNK